MFCPGDNSFMCKGNYTISQHDMDTGYYRALFFVTSSSPSGVNISSDLEYTVDLIGAAGIVICEQTTP